MASSLVPVPGPKKEAGAPTQGSLACSVGFTLEGETEERLKKQKTLQFEHSYRLSQKLRSGSYGTVYVCQTQKEHGGVSEEYAVKVIDRTKLKEKDDAAVFREVSVLLELRSINGVVQLMDFYVTPSVFYVVQQYARGGDLFDRLSHRKTYTESDARQVAKSLLETIADIHRKRYVHRDLKTENLLLQDEISDTSILVADFGFCKHCPEGKFLKTRCGTPAFVAPEVLIGETYNETVDMWGVGVIFYLLIGGYPPFRDNHHRGLFRKIRAGDYVFHDAYWGEVSVEAKQLIASLLTVDPAYRATAEEALDCEWLKMKDASLSQNDLSGSLSEMKEFHAKRSLKGAVKAVRWMMTAKFWNPDSVTFAKQLSAWDVSFKQELKTVDPQSPVKEEKKLLTFKDSYELKTKIRKGSFATVWECVHRATGDIYAVKIIVRKDLKPTEDENVLNEVAIVQSLEYKHIVQVVDFYEEPEHFYIIMELMRGGDVFDRIVERTRYTEKDARDLVRILLKVCKHMHDRGIAHRDLKPQNLLLQSREDDADIKVGDFGFARRVHTPQSLTTRCGTPTYVSPEILKNVPHDTATDMWSVGVIAFVLLVGYPPFMEDNQKLLFEKIRTGEYEFMEADWKHISDDAMNLIRGLLVVDPLKRLTADEALGNRWILEDGDSLSSRDLTDSLKILKERKSRLRGFARAVLAFGRDSKSEPRVLQRPSTIQEGTHDTMDESELAEKKSSVV